MSFDKIDFDLDSHEKTILWILPHLQIIMYMKAEIVLQPNKKCLPKLYVATSISLTATYKLMVSYNTIMIDLHTVRT